jgi:aconitase B
VHAALVAGIAKIDLEGMRPLALQHGEVGIDKQGKGSAHERQCVRVKAISKDKPKQSFMFCNYSAAVSAAISRCKQHGFAASLRHATEATSS